MPIIQRLQREINRIAKIFPSGLVELIEHPYRGNAVGNVFSVDANDARCAKASTTREVVGDAAVDMPADVLQDVADARAVGLQRDAKLDHAVAGATRGQGARRSGVPGRQQRNRDDVRIR